MGGYGGSMRPMLGYEWNKLGGGILYRYRPRGALQGMDKSFLENLIEMPINSNLMGRFMRASSYGAQEISDARVAASEVMNAKMRGRETRYIDGELKKYHQANPVRSERLHNVDQIMTDVNIVVNNVLESMHPTSDLFDPNREGGWSREDRNAIIMRDGRRSSLRNRVQRGFLNLNSQDFQRDFLFGVDATSTTPDKRLSPRGQLLNSQASRYPSDAQWAWEVMQLVAYRPGLIPTETRSSSQLTLVDYLTDENLNRLSSGLEDMTRQERNDDNQEIDDMMRGLGRRRGSGGRWWRSADQ